MAKAAREDERPGLRGPGSAMISTGELLALLADSDQRWQRLRARYVLRRSLPEEDRPRRAGAGPLVTAGNGGPEVTFDVFATTRPFRLRAARVPQPTEPPVAAPDLAVDDGTALWMQTGADVHQLRWRVPFDPWIADVSRLLVPRALSAAHRLRVVGDEGVAGRACWRVAARAFQDPPPAGEVDGELLVDQRTGVILSQHWHRQGQPVHSAEVTSVEVDGPLSPELFTYTVPPGARVSDGLPVPVPARYQPALFVGLLAAGAADAAVGLARALRPRRWK